MFRSVGPVGEILFRVTIIESFLKATSLQIRIFLKPHTFYTNQPSIYTKPVNPVTKTALFWNRSSEWFNASSTRIRIKNVRV